jgi:4-amino-4-deoxy-L-arabinose transferase-like glycosyltransferase
MRPVAAQAADRLSAAVDIARRHPGRVLAAVLVGHLVVWTFLPMLLSANLQLDLVEGLALGKEWQIGYWKHPPLPWWVTDLIYRVTGDVRAVYALGPLAAIVCMLGVYALARDMVGPAQALIPVLALEGIHYYNISAVKFAHDQMQLPVWAWGGFFLYRALTRGSALYWLAAGAMVALAFWTKYSAVVFGLSLGLFLLVDPRARASWRTPGPYLMALAFAVVVAPHALWLIENYRDSPLVYAEGRSLQHRYGFIVTPLRWIGGQLAFVAPALLLIALAYGPRPAVVPADEKAAFDRRYATMLAFGPFVLVTLAFVLSGRSPVLLWGYPLWSFLPLAATVWLGPVTDGERLKSFAAGWLVIFVTLPLIYALAPVVEAQFRNRQQAIHFPGREAAEHMTRAWREKTSTPLTYVTGEEFVANNVAVYSPDRPHVIVEGRFTRAPWVDAADARRKGILVVWTAGLEHPILMPLWARTFGFKVSDATTVEFKSHSPRGTPVRLRYVVIPPQP